MPISKKRLKEIKSIKDSDIDYSDIPELDEEFFKNARLVIPGEDLDVSEPVEVKPEIVSWFKRHSKNYQARINSVLTSHIKSQDSSYTAK